MTENETKSFSEKIDISIDYWYERLSKEYPGQLPDKIIFSMIFLKGIGFEIEQEKLGGNRR